MFHNHGIVEDFKNKNKRSLCRYYAIGMLQQVCPKCQVNVLNTLGALILQQFCPKCQINNKQ